MKNTTNDAQFDAYLSMAEELNAAIEQRWSDADFAEAGWVEDAVNTTVVAKDEDAIFNNVTTYALTYAIEAVVSGLALDFAYDADDIISKYYEAGEAAALAKKEYFCTRDTSIAAEAAYELVYQFAIKEKLTYSMVRTFCEAVEADEDIFFNFIREEMEDETTETAGAELAETSEEEVVLAPENNTTNNEGEEAMAETTKELTTNTEAKGAETMAADNNKTTNTTIEGDKTMKTTKETMKVAANKKAQNKNAAEFIANKIAKEEAKAAAKGKTVGFKTGVSILADGTVRGAVKTFLINNGKAELVEREMNLEKRREMAMDKLMKKFVNKSRKRILKKEQNVTVNVLRADRAGKLHVNITTMDENEAIRLGYIAGSKGTARYGKSGIAVDNHTKDLIVLDLSQNKSIANSTMELYVSWNGARTVFARQVVTENDETVFVDVLTNKTVTRKSWRKYAAIGGSPSMLRKDSILLFDVTNGYDKMDEILDAVTDGGYSIYKGQGVTAAELSKYVTRFFSWTAPNKVLGLLTVPAIYFGKYHEAGNEANDAVLDGMAHVDAEFYADCVAESLGVTVAPKHVMGASVQCRPYSAKVNALVSDLAEMMPVLAAGTKGIKYVPMNTVDSKVQAELNKAFKGKGEYAGYIVVFGEEGTKPQFITDLNGYKTSVNWSKPSNFRVLDIAKAGKFANTSIQMWEVPMNREPKAAIALMKELRDEQFSKVFEELFFERKVTVPSLVETQKSLYVHNVAKQIAPDYALDKDYKMFQTLYKEFFTRLQNADNKFKYEVAGSYTRLFADNSILVAADGVLQFGEVYSPTANAFFANPENAAKYENAAADVKATFGKRIVTFTKYPKMGRNEMYKAVAVSLDTIIKRIKALGLDADQEKALINSYATLQKGATIMPAVELLKQLLAGMDFDYDGAAEVYDPRFNVLISDEYMITNIVKEKAAKKVEKKATSKMAQMAMSEELNKDSKITICAKELNKAFLTYVSANTGGWSVGSITNCNTTQLAALTLAKVMGTDKSFALLRGMLERWFVEHLQMELANNEGVKYVGLPTRVVDLSKEDVVFSNETVARDTNGTLATVVDVSQSAINAAIASMKECDLTDKENLIHIFEDLNEMFRFYQEITIDSAKTGEMVTVTVAPGKFYHALMLNDNTFDVKWSKTLADSIVQYEANTEVASESKQGIADVMFKIRTRDFLPETIEMARNVLDSKKVGLNIDDVQNLAKNFATEKYAALNEAFFDLKNIYGDLTSNWIEARAAAGDDEEVVNFVDKDYKASLEKLAATGRQLTAGMSNELRGAYAKFIATHRKLQNGYAFATDGGNEFAAKVFAKEYLAFIVKNYGVIDFCGEELAYNEFYVDGDEIELVNGVGEYCMTYADITGKFIVKEFDGKFYATMKIVDAVPVASEEPTDLAVRVANKKGVEWAKVAADLEASKEVIIRAESYRDENNKMVHDYAIYNKATNELIAPIDCSSYLAKLINKYSGKVSSLKLGETEFNNKKTPYIVVLF